MTSAFTVKFADLFGECLLLEAMPASEAMKVVFPIWKKLNGVLPTPFAKAEPLWKGMAGPETASYAADGTIYIGSFGGQKLERQYSATWRAK